MKTTSVKKTTKPKAHHTLRPSALFDKYDNPDYLLKLFESNINRYKYPKSEYHLMHKALDFARLAHNGHSRDSGQPYIHHPIRVANILMDELKLTSSEAVCAAMLHDVIEDAGITIKELKNNFNDVIAANVKTLSKDPKAVQPDKAYRHKILQASPEVKLIKLCDRLDNMRSLRFSINQTRMRKYIRDTEKFYLPLAQECHAYLFHEIQSELTVLQNRLRALKREKTSAKTK